MTQDVVLWWQGLILHDDMQSQFFGSPCNQGPVSIPSTGVQWTCGIRLDGTFNCTCKQP